MKVHFHKAVEQSENKLLSHSQVQDLEQKPLCIGGKTLNP